MPVTRRARSLALLLAAGSAPVLLALSLRARPAPVPAAPESASLQTARLLDSIAQDRFASARMVVFGTSRIATAATTQRHALSMAPETPAEADTLGKINAHGQPYLVAFVHCAPVPEALSQRTAPFPGVSSALFAVPPVTVLGQRRMVPSAAPGMLPAPSQPYLTPLILHPQGPPAPVAVRPAALVAPGPLVPPGAPTPAVLASDAPIPPDMQAAQQSLLLRARTVLPSLLRGRQYQDTTGGWTYLLSPVQASGGTCLSCHVGAKRGDTLGVMAYAVRDAPAGR